MSKKRKLSPSEVEVLRKLENELQEEQRVLQKNLEAIKIAFDNDSRELTRKAGERVKQGAIEFNKNKRQLEIDKAAALRRAEDVYQKGLTLLHFEKTGVCTAAESWLALEQKEIEEKYKSDVAGISHEFQKLMEDNLGKQKLIKEGTGE